MRRLAYWILHYRAKLYRGIEVKRLNAVSGGVYIQYESGYIEFVDPQGKKIDVVRVQHLRANKKRDWKCSPYGGGASIIFNNMTRNAAMERAARELGPVRYVDEQHGFIFYKKEGAAHGTLPE